MLKTSCVLLKVLLLTTIASSLEDLKDLEASDIAAFEINDHNTLSNIEIVQDYSDSVAVKNEVESIPSEPTFPRAFVEFDKSVNEKNNISVTFRWKQPEFTNRVIQKYSVEYWFVENLNRTIQSIDIISTTILQHKVYDVKPDTMYYFKVRAHNEVGPGPYTKTINVLTTHENPVPLLLVNSSSGMQVLDMDLQINFPLNEYRAMEFAYSALERKIYWINDKWQLMTMDLNTSSIKTKQNYTKIADLDAPAHNLCIDWVARNLYWIQISNQTSNIMKLDITLWQMGIVKYKNILKINGFTHLNVLPSIGYLYWMGLNSDNEHMIMQSDFDVRRMKPFLKSKSNFCSCRYKLEPSSLQIDNTNIDKPLMYWISKDRLIVADIYGCNCKLIFSAGNNQILFNYLTIDKTNIYLHSNSERLIYILEKKYALLESTGNAIEHVQKVNMSYTSDTHRVIAFGKSLQPYPPTICLIPHMKDYRVEVVTITANSIAVRLPEPVFNDGCRKHNLATTIYTISVSYCLNNDRNECEEFNVQTYERHYKIQNLMPFTEYTLKLALSNFYVDKLSMGLLFGSGVILTTPDVPSAPGKPTITGLPNFMYQLNWESVQAHHSQVTLYRLEGLVVENNYTEGNETHKNEHWNLYYNGTDSYWIITRDMNQKYQFRVRAENAYGIGEWSELSAVIDLTQSIDILITLYLPLILCLVITLVYVCCFYCLYRQRKRSNEVLPPIMTDIESGNLHEIFPGNVQPNALYAPRLQYHLDEFKLIIIEKKQITLRKCLGSGAFGKVFQGTVENLDKAGTTPVAIKVLRKNASSQVKKKFLQEIKIMSQFHHKHVLRLLGICLDADSPLIILELMEAGDLLKYLRESRTLQPSDSHALRLQDLLAMCEDVARGCCYLEKLHFVHRDLACRNCFISARNRENRIVKIGDFGLARDIYTNDYYRTKGEEVLPVRWMAPESLMDGIFTSKSDVWAFGVLMWEITSLGEQPYPAKNSNEVLQYVLEGGMLPKPLNCPPMLYQLMQHCWSALYDRPNFIHCLENIVTLRDNIEDAILSSVDIIRHEEIPPFGQIEELEATIPPNYLIANDASNDVIEPLT